MSFPADSLSFILAVAAVLLPILWLAIFGDIELNPNKNSFRIHNDFTARDNR
jgi:hypothetical protein